MEKRDSMSKVRIQALLENKTEQEQHKVETFGIQNGNHIVYLDNDIQTHITIEEGKISMKRVQNEALLKCCFIAFLTTPGIYDIKSINKILDIKIYTKKLSIQTNSLEITYEMILEDELPKEFSYQLKYEVIS